jgi:hypothetical protein
MTDTGTVLPEKLNARGVYPLPGQPNVWNGRTNLPNTEHRIAELTAQIDEAHAARLCVGFGGCRRGVREGGGSGTSLEGFLARSWVWLRLSGLAMARTSCCGSLCSLRLRSQDVFSEQQRPASGSRGASVSPAAVRSPPPAAGHAQLS